MILSLARALRDAAAAAKDDGVNVSIDPDTALNLAAVLDAGRAACNRAKGPTSFLGRLQEALDHAERGAR